MKSIKEKAEEWADMYPSCGMADKSFQAGADYVLDELEKTIERAEYYSDMSLKSFFYEDLKYMIQELKK